ncbi:MAG: hypothetical protein HY271_01815 [Deltaproteobacteria bacterium]|nr:hypothetical protein [Deltaproteobacteria bacterium]
MAARTGEVREIEHEYGRECACMGGAIIRRRDQSAAVNAIFEELVTPAKKGTPLNTKEVSSAPRQIAPSWGRSR